MHIRTPWKTVTDFFLTETRCLSVDFILNVQENILKDLKTDFLKLL